MLALSDDNVPAAVSAARLPVPADVPAPDSDDPAEIAAHGRNLAALGLIHLRHAGAPRAMVLGLAAMAMGDLRPRTVLMVTEALLQAGDPAQAMTALSRFEGDGVELSQPPTTVEEAARHYLAARILMRQNREDEARAALDLAMETAAKARAERGE